MSSSCPHCHRQLAIADIVVRDQHWGGRLQTCGRIVIERLAKVRVQYVQACEGIEVQGSLKGKIVSYGPVTRGAGSSLAGDLEAPAVYVSPGAQIVGGRFRIAPVASQIANGK
jgi:cytoskeletal protein CcmA (bactofilin family)